MKHKGAFNFVWMFGAILLVMAPILVAFLLGGILRDLPAAAYYIIGYAALFIVDFLIVKGVMRIPPPMALAISTILPFVQGGIAFIARG